MSDNPYDPKSLRLSQDFQSLGGTKKVLTTIPVRKPGRLEYVRVHPDPDMRVDQALLLEFSIEQETYLIAPQLYDSVAAEARVKALFFAVNRQGGAFVWPVNLPGRDGRSNAWNDSALQAAMRATKQWVRVRANLEAGLYDVLEPQAQLPEPGFPELSLTQVLELAFRDRLIQSTDHPALRRLRGEE